MDTQERGKTFIYIKGMIDEIDDTFQSEGLTPEDFDPVTGDLLESSVHKLK